MLNNAQLARTANLKFPMAMAFSCLLMGSLSTTIFFGASIVVIFFNKKLTLSGLLVHIASLHKKIPLLLIFPATPIVILLTSIFRDNPIDGLLIAGSYIHFFVIAPMAIGLHVMTPKAHLFNRFVQSLPCAAIIVFFIAVFQITYLDIRPEGFSGNSLIFGTLALAASVLMISWVHVVKDKFTQTKFLLGFTFALSASLLSLSRSIVIISVIVIIVLVFISLVRRQNSIHFGRFFLVACFMLCFIFLMLHLAPNMTNWLLGRFRNPVQNYLANGSWDASFDTRMTLLLAGFQAFKENWLLGVGIQNFGPAIEGKFLSASGETVEFNFTHLHNDFLTHGLGGGIILLNLFSVVLMSPLLLAKKLDRNTKNIHIKSAVFLFTLVYLGMALTNIVFRQDLTMTLFSIVIVFILVEIFRQEPGAFK